jgi:transcriptional regulator with XRE-family HTH domain
MGNKLSDFILEKTKGVNQVDLAKALGVSQSFLSRLKSGQIKTADATLAIDMAVFFREPLEKMLALVGKERYCPKIREALGPDNQKEPTIVEIFPDQETKLEFDSLQTRDDFVAIRIVGTASLGPGLAIHSEETKGYALVYKNAIPRKARKQTRRQEKIVCVFSKGTSMLPTIQDKSLVAIDIEDRDEIQNNKIYAVAIPEEREDGISLKRVVKSGNFLMLLADNQNEPGFPKFINRADLEYNPICGRVVWAWNKF